MINMVQQTKRGKKVCAPLAKLEGSDSTGSSLLLWTGISSTEDSSTGDSSTRDSSTGDSLTRDSSTADSLYSKSPRAATAEHWAAGVISEQQLDPFKQPNVDGIGAVEV